MAKKRNPDNRNITRIETRPPDGKRAIMGYEVRIYRRGERFNEFFSDNAHGGKPKALEAARVVRDKMEKKLRPYTRRELANKATERTTSGHRGIRIRTTTIIKAKKKYVYDHVEASWSPEPGRVVKKSFSVKKLGRRKAWELAIECRRKAVARIKG